MHTFLRRIGFFAARRHWYVIAAWVVVLAAVALLRNQFGGDYVNNYTVPGSQSSTGLNLLNKEFPQQGGYAGQIVFHAKSGTLTADTSVVNEAMTSVGTLPHVVRAVSPFAQQDSPLVSKDQTIAYGNVAWDTVPASLPDSYLHQLDAAVAPARAAGLEVEYGGGAGQIDQGTNDLRSEIIGLSCALLLLLLMFASIAAAAVPLLSAIFSVGAGLSLVGLLAAATTFPTTAPTVATLLGLGVAVDYGLFLVARHREQVDHGMNTRESIARSVSTSGAAIVIAGGTVVIAILGLYVSGVPFVGAMGAASAVVVAVTMLAALTLVPAFLGVAGNSVRAMSSKRRMADAAAEQGIVFEPGHEHNAFARWGLKVSGRPAPWAIGASVLLCILAIPLLSMRLGQLDAGTNPTSESIRRAYDLVAKGFGPGANGPLSVVVELPAGGSDNQSTLQSLQSTLTKTPGIASVSQPSVNQAGTTAVLTAIPTTSPQNAATTELVNHLRDSVLPTVPDKTYIVGTTASYIDFTAKTSARMIWLILAVVALSFVLLTTAFRSLVIATKAALFNLISVGASYGVIVAVFQWGWGSGLVGIDEKLPIPSFVPMLMFAIVFGLSMDYEVFLLSRVREAWHQTGDAHRAVAIGIGSTARVITTAAAIMVVVFSSFVLDTDPTIKMLAVGMAVAVLIDASVVRMVLVPALMSILGAHAWYLPRWLDRIIPDLQLEGSVEPVASAEPASQDASEARV
jgi:RND superfamily putative drug exporter